MKTINKKMYQALENAIMDEYSCFDHMAMFNAIEYMLRITDECEYDATLRAVNSVLEECEPADRKVKEILEDYHMALQENDMIAMAELITEMKKTDPVYVSLMMNAMWDDEE